MKKKKKKKREREKNEFPTLYGVRRCVGVRVRIAMVDDAQGELRVGMEAWIMGRQSVTWQHPVITYSFIIISKSMM